MQSLKKDKGFIITLIVMIIMIIGLLYYYFYSKNLNTVESKNNLVTNTGNITTNNNTTTTNNTVTEEKTDINKVTRLDNYNTFFSINELINDYYDILLKEDKIEVLNILDEIYITQNKLNSSNVNDTLTTSYTDFDFYITKIYYKENEKVIYYFVNGSLNKYDFVNETLILENKSMILINDKENKTYSILPINNPDDLNEYAISYSINNDKIIEQNSNNKMINQKYDAEYITLKYIVYYKNLLYLDTQKAYNMLSSSNKNNYPTLETFTNDLENIYNELSTNIYGYSSKEYSNSVSYSAKTKNGKTITFTEKNIMEFTVEIF